MTQMTRQLIVELECVKGHPWQSAVIAVDWNGALYEDAFCANCGRTGTRRRITSEGIGGVLTPEEIASVGQYAIHTLLFCLQDLINPDDHKAPKQAAYTYMEIAKNVAERASKIEESVKQLVRDGWLDIAFIGKEVVSGDQKFKLSCGPKLLAVVERMAEKAKGASA